MLCRNGRRQPVSCDACVRARCDWVILSDLSRVCTKRWRQEEEYFEDAQFVSRLHPILDAEEDPLTYLLHATAIAHCDRRITLAPVPSPTNNNTTLRPTPTPTPIPTPKPKLMDKQVEDKDAEGATQSSGTTESSSVLIPLLIAASVAIGLIVIVMGSVKIWRAHRECMEDEDFDEMDPTINVVDPTLNAPCYPKYVDYCPTPPIPIATSLSATEPSSYFQESAHDDSSNAPPPPVYGEYTF